MSTVVKNSTSNRLYDVAYNALHIGAYWVYCYTTLEKYQLTYTAFSRYCMYSTYVWVILLYNRWWIPQNIILFSVDLQVGLRYSMWLVTCCCFWSLYKVVCPVPRESVSFFTDDLYLYSTISNKHLYSLVSLQRGLFSFHCFDSVRHCELILYLSWTLGKFALGSTWWIYCHYIFYSIMQSSGGFFFRFFLEVLGGLCGWSHCNSNRLG